MVEGESTRQLSKFCWGAARLSNFDWGRGTTLTARSVPLVIFGLSNIGFVGLGVATAIKETRVQCGGGCARQCSEPSVHSSLGVRKEGSNGIGNAPPLRV